MHRSDHSHIPTQAAPITRGRTIRWAHHYDSIVKLLTLGKEAGLRKETIRQASIPIGASVLDLGCGTGTLTLLAKAEAGQQGSVYGIDASPEMILVARQKAVQQKRDVEFQTALIEALPFSDGRFDVVLSSLMFHHLPPDLQQHGLTEIYRVLKPGGHLLIVDMKRPTTSSQRIGLNLSFHRGMIDGVHELAPLMKELGYVRIESGDMHWKLLGFIRGQRAI